jgi:hypothetical protein
MIEQSDNLETLFEKLKSSVMFNLSLSSKELFHSNFLAWLCECYPKLVGQIFVSYLKTPTGVDYELKAFRERYNIDLTLEFSSNGLKQQLIIENKVKSIPRLDQLKLYTKNIPAKSKSKIDTTITETNFLLLSLTKPSFLDKENQTKITLGNEFWHYISYRELAEKLSSVQSVVAKENSYHGLILKDYIFFIMTLQEIYEMFSINSNNRNTNFYIRQEDHELIKENRLHDLVDKLRYSQLAELISQKLRDEGFVVTADNWCDAKHGQIFVNSTMTRGIGLCDLKYVLFDKHKWRGNPLNLGVQVQGRSFRLVLESEKNKSEVIAERLLDNKLWFDLSNIPGDSTEYPTKRKFDNYSRAFWYRYKNLLEISTNDLVELIVKFARIIRDQKEELEQEIGE